MNHAIKIIDILESTRLKVFPFTKDIPLEEQSHCPACNIPLQILCLLVTEARDHRLRYGLCAKCGYMGYIDRPQQSWMIDFYTTNWDRATPATEAEVKNRTIVPGPGIKPSGHLAASLIHKLNLQKDRIICEMGSGYGEALKYFKDAGFTNIIGVENSKHRADLVQKILGFQVLQGEFENSRVQEELLKRKPIGLIFSHQVLEHVYHPQEIFEKISALQDLGDYVIVAVPNATGEHINHGPLFLPHLHSFTKESLEILLYKNGYEIIADNSVTSDVIFAAQKVQNSQLKFTSGADYFALALARLKKGFAANLLKKDKIYRLYWGWAQGQDYSQIISENIEGIIPKILWYIDQKIAYFKARILKHFASGCTMLVTHGENKESIFEIQFQDTIRLLIK